MTGRAIDREIILRALSALKDRYDVIVGEGGGGLLVPLNDEGWLQEKLIRDMGFSCLLVSRAGLGTINATLLTLRGARAAGLNVKGIVISGAGDSLIEQDNIAMIKKLSGIESIFVVPRISGLSPQTLQIGDLHDVFEKSISAEQIVSLVDDIG